MRLSRIEKLSWVGCPWIFGMVYIVLGLIPSGKEPVVKTLTVGFGLLFMSLYCIASLLAKLAEKDAVQVAQQESEQVDGEGLASAGAPASPSS